MSTNTYVALQTQVLGSAQSSVTFSSIPQTYTDLVLIISGVQTIDDNIILQFNSDTSNNYSVTTIYGSGSSAVSFRGSNQNSAQLGGMNTSGIGNIIAHIMNYSNTTTYKTILNRANSTGLTQARVNLWQKQYAITSILVGTGSGNMAAGTTLTLYAIQAA